MDNPVRFPIVGQAPIVGDLGPEVIGVSPNSVDAVVGGGDDHGQHLPLAAAQWRLAEHDGPVEVHRSLHRPRILAHDTDDVPYSAGAFQSCLIFLFQEASRFLQRKNLYPGHGT
jgi:hypothetical protein